jgi:hypothetical protein
VSRNAQKKTWVAGRLWPALLCGLLLASSSRAGTGDRSSSPDTRRPAQVITVQDPEATKSFAPREDRIRGMVSRGITRLTGKPTVAAAWSSLVATQDIVGIKVFSEPGPNSGTRPAVVAVMIEGLLAAGLPPDHIIIWDKRQIDLRLAGFWRIARRFGVRVAASTETGFDDDHFYETPLLGNLVWGDHEFGKKAEGLGRKSFVSKLVSQQMTKIINVTPLMNHNEAGVAGNLFSLALGSVDNSTRFESEPERLATAVPEIYALPVLGDRVVLNLVDALICQYEGEERSLLHYSTPLNQLRFSRDPVALDVLSLLELERQRHGATAPALKSRLELYRNATLLELGESDTNRIQIETIMLPPPQEPERRPDPARPIEPARDKTEPHSSRTDR